MGEKRKLKFTKEGRVKKILVEEEEEEEKEEEKEDEARHDDLEETLDHVPDATTSDDEDTNWTFLCYAETFNWLTSME